MNSISCVFMSDDHRHHDADGLLWSSTGQILASVPLFPAASSSQITIASIISNLWLVYHLLTSHQPHRHHHNPAIRQQLPLRATINRYRSPLYPCSSCKTINFNSTYTINTSHTSTNEQTKLQPRILA